MSTEQYHAPQEDQQYNRPATPNDLPPGGYREPGRKEKSRGRKILERSVAGTVLAGVLGGGAYIGVKATQHDAPAPTNPNRPTSSAPAVPGPAETSGTTSAPDAATAALLDPEKVPITVLQPDGTEKTYVGATAYVDAFQVKNSAYVPSEHALDELLANLNTMGHIVSDNPAYSAQGNDGDTIRANIDNITLRTILQVKPDPTDYAGQSIVSAQTSDETDPSVVLGAIDGKGGLNSLVAVDLQKDQIHNFIVKEDATTTKTGNISATPEEDAPHVVIEDQTIDRKTGKVISDKTETLDVHYSTTALPIDTAGTYRQDYISLAEKE